MLRALPQRQGSTPIEILLNPAALDAAAYHAWQVFIRAAAGAIGRGLSLGTFNEAPFDDRSVFAFISDSLALSRKLFFKLPRIYIQPRCAPLQVDPFFYWKLKAILDDNHQLEPRVHKVTLFSSIFNGDHFLPGFLQNCSALQGYARYEHYLIRAASPGSEQALLIEHVLRWPSAIYLNLAADPGLYEVWNLGVCLAGGRYLSNANVDDRRAPEHVAELTRVLDSQPNVSVAAAALRISTVPNLDWVDSADCPCMFSNVESGVYSADMLFKRTGQSLSARNLPHCMPIWRRSLHARFGFFDEKRYGPSADWAYWLYCTSRGRYMYFDQRPLGVYLRHEENYWRRNTVNDIYDNRILAEYEHIAIASDSRHGSAATTSKTLSSSLEEAVTLLRSGAGQEGVGLLLEALLSRPQAGKAEDALIGHIVSTCLGGDTWTQWIEPYAYSQQFIQDAPGGVFATIITILHEIDKEIIGERLLQIRCLLEFICFDLCESYSNIRGLLLFAFLSHSFGENELEQSVLKYVHGRDEKEFWLQIQSAYRFAKSLADLIAVLHEANDRTAAFGGAAQDTNLVYFPQYTGNAYLDLLYKPFVTAGGRLEGTLDSTHFLSVAPIPDKSNILHLHWVERLLSPPKAVAESPNAQAAAVLEALTRQKARGFKLYWTIHNYLGHECREHTTELDFRRSLYMLADRVFVHHPLASSLLDWLPDHQKLCVCEHGPYNIPKLAQADREDIRLQLGFAKTDFVVTYIGRICDYKGLAVHLPLLLEMLNQIPHMKLVFAGLIRSQEVWEWLSLHPHPRLIIKNVRLNDEDLARHMQAADIGFLSYAAILTSGTLFHWLSCGCPVLAPPIGTIAAYLVDGWNGYTYRDSDQLKEILLYCASLPKQELTRLQANAAKTARQLDWRMWKLS